MFGGGLAAGVALAGAATGAAQAQGRTASSPDILDGRLMQEPPANISAGPIKPGRGSLLTGKVAVVTGAARGIGRAIAVEMAANGADVVVLDIAGPVSPASDAAAATPAELDETVRQIKAYGRRSDAIRADILDIAGLRAAADAAIQRWKPLLEMEDTDWHDVIDTNLNGTATPSARLHRKWLRAGMAGSLCSPRCRASTAPRMRRAVRHRSGASSV